MATGAGTSSGGKRISPGLYVIFANRGIEIDRYPAIESHLRWFRRDLAKRATAHLHPWYELQQPQEGIFHEFSQPKIVWPDITPEARFAYDATGSYLGNTSYVMPTGLTWFLPVLNSSLFEFILCQLTTSVLRGSLRLFSQYMAQLPTVMPDNGAEAELEKLAEEILEL